MFALARDKKYLLTRGESLSDRSAHCTVRKEVRISIGSRIYGHIILYTCIRTTQSCHSIESTGRKKSQLFHKNKTKQKGLVFFFLVRRERRFIPKNLLFFKQLIRGNIFLFFARRVLCKYLCNDGKLQTKIYF